MYSMMWDGGTICVPAFGGHHPWWQVSWAASESLVSCAIIVCFRNGETSESKRQQRQASRAGRRHLSRFEWETDCPIPSLLWGNVGSPTSSIRWLGPLRRWPYSPPPPPFILSTWKACSWEEVSDASTGLMNICLTTHFFDACIWINLTLLMLLNIPNLQDTIYLYSCIMIWVHSFTCFPPCLILILCLSFS